MFKMSRDQINGPRRPALISFWSQIGAEEGLDETRAKALQSKIVDWVLQHSIEYPENVDFVFRSHARSDGTFTTAPPIVKLMTQSDGAYELAISSLRRTVQAKEQSGWR